MRRKKKPIRWRYKRNKTEELRNSRFQKKSEDRIVKKDVFSQKRSSIFFVVFHVVCSLFYSERRFLANNRTKFFEKISFAFGVWNREKKIFNYINYSFQLIVLKMCNYQISGFPFLAVPCKETKTSEATRKKKKILRYGVFK